LQLKELERLGKRVRLAADWKKPWQILISTMLSARTRDEKTIEVSNVLYKKYRNVEELANAKISDVRRIIKQINFYKGKAKRIILCAKIISKEYNGKIPVEFEKLIKLPGVGRKTANVYLAVLGYSEIGVDTHVSQISRALGWTRHSKQKDIENDLKRLFPKQKWREINYVLVRFGRSHNRKKQKDLLNQLKKI